MSRIGPYQRRDKPERKLSPNIIARSGWCDCWWWSCLLLTFVSFVAIVDASTGTPSTVTTRVMATVKPPPDGEKEILLVFSDLDGTLVHYPKKRPRSERHNSLLKLPPSSTGLRGIVSSKTLSLVRDIRKKNAKFVLVSGMRTSTLLARLPFLPKADAYCTEAGGRIFYPVAPDDQGFVVKPQTYDGCSPTDLEPFSLVEDMEWRAKMKPITGDYGLSDLKELSLDPSKIPPLNERDGLLWDFARHLSAKGYVLDLAGYSACFRVNQKQQTTTISAHDFAALSNGELKVYEGLATSVNLACVDFYPASSGKKNCCQYLAEKFYPEMDDENLLHYHSVCLCDDDNDVEMATACRHAYIPEITSGNLAALIEKYPEHFTVTGGAGSERSGPAASEAALSLILQEFGDGPVPTVTAEIEENSDW